MCRSSVQTLPGEQADEDVAARAQTLTRQRGVASEFILIHCDVDGMSLI
jgi:hypothetical protein